VVAFGLGVFVTLGQVRANNPEVADKTGTDLASSGAQVFGLGGSWGGSAIAATGGIMQGGKMALQSSGLGEALTPDTTIPAATQPAIP
jgi:hypothetical protein